MALSVKVADNGDHEIGQKVGGAWITYLRVPAFRVTQALEAAQASQPAAKAAGKGKGADAPEPSENSTGDTTDESKEGGR